MFGLGYTLNENKVIVNEKVYRINNGLDKNNVSISYEDNMLTINLPSNLSERENKIEFYIKLIGRNVNYKYITSQDSYVTFIPNYDNDFYSKKSSQSYVIDGSAYIRLSLK